MILNDDDRAAAHDEAQQQCEQSRLPDQTGKRLFAAFMIPPAYILALRAGSAAARHAGAVNSVNGLRSYSSPCPAAAGPCSRDRLCGISAPFFIRRETQHYDLGADCIGTKGIDLEGDVAAIVAHLDGEDLNRF